MSTTFPISKEQFIQWLRQDPKALCNAPLRGYCCPIANAIYQLTGRRMSLLEPAELPEWVRSFSTKIDNFVNGWRSTRGIILTLIWEPPPEEGENEAIPQRKSSGNRRSGRNGGDRDPHRDAS